MEWLGAGAELEQNLSERSEMPSYYVGVDLGQQQDYTAIAVAQKVGEDLQLRHLERFRDMLYPDQAAHIVALVTRLEERGEVSTAVDRTGVGAGVVDMLTKQGLSFTGVTITGGDKPSRDGREHRVPKRDLVYALVVALQNGGLKIAASLQHAETLRAELMNFRVKVSATGHDSYEHAREGDHDDLVLAAALASWAAGGRRWELY